MYSYFFRALAVAIHSLRDFQVLLLWIQRVRLGAANVIDVRKC
jgi:hypothetical protein